jgi:SWI/SNF-related matrix-associated actin-dependent regulator of chromatin subfamily A3
VILHLYDLKFLTRLFAVCPLSVLGNWETQMAEHCVRGTLSAYTYYGNTRNVDPEVLKAYDVVLTTYQTVSSDFERAGGFKTVEELVAQKEAPSIKKRKVDKGLFDIKWKVCISFSLRGFVYTKYRIACGTG